jgi:oligopeptide/dipeptide ABC transporter ATP-binding protein
MELTDRDELYMNPLNPYTQSLMSAVPVPDPLVEEKRRRIILEGDIPSPSRPPEGCNFSTRCPAARDICFEADPELIEVEVGHFCACHVVEQEGRAEIG